MALHHCRIWTLLGLIGLAASCKTDSRRFKLLPPSESGINFKNELRPTEELNILTYLYYYNGAGVAVADFNNDGLNDIYLTSNQGADKFYLNRGGLKFEDVTSQAGIENFDGWTTGVSHVDINNDGLLDIYVCKVGKYKSIEGSNILFINQGVDQNNVPTFKENSADYGLDVVAFSTQAAFFDYDLDGDSDMYLLAHSVHPNRSYGKGESRKMIDSLAGDRLFENVDGKFKDVSGPAGIFQGRIGYGLGLAIGDVNGDGYPDIYVSNDFFEHDYLYQNNGDKTFTELNSNDPKILGHSSHYSMGNCIADMNNDGMADIMSLDMLPEDIQTLKTSGVEDGFPVYNRFLANGYSPQFMQNTLHINNGFGSYSEVGFQSGIAATEWSWGVLAADYDMDGFKDLYITNGIFGATNDMDYINYISQDKIQKSLDKNATGRALDIARNIPEKKVKNYAFRNNGNISFTNLSSEWFESRPSLSNGSAYGDLDNDGDLDLVVNNINEEAFIFINRSNDDQARNFLTARFKGLKGNTNGIGAKLEIFANDLYVYEENFPVRSYLSAVPNEMVIGLGSHNYIDSIRITWPNSKREVLFGVDANQVVYFDQERAIKIHPGPPKAHLQPDYLSNADYVLDFVHHEETTLDFERDPLIPFALSNEGPRIDVADVNGDAFEDLFIGGGKMQASKLFLQAKGGYFVSVQEDLFSKDARSEDIDHIFFDADNDLDMDLLVVSGGNEFTGGPPLKPRLYINDSEKFTHNETAFGNIEINASVVRVVDIDCDGDNDIILCSNALPGRFGENAKNYLFENDGAGRFEDVTFRLSKDFQNGGLITDLKIADLDGNGYEDLVTVGLWMPITIYMNSGKSLTTKILPGTEGWWKSVALADFDKDGDVDFVAGNWGLNTRLAASAEAPVKLYRADFDNNGSAETLITYFYQGREILLSSMDELAKQMPFIRKKFTTYLDFAKADIADIFSDDKIKGALKKEAKLLATCYFENDGINGFERRNLPFMAQQSSVNAIAVDDFDNDGFLDLLMVGNNYEISTQLGRLDASHGVLLLNDQSGFFKERRIQNFNVAGAARDIKKISINGADYYVVSLNNDRPLFLKKNAGKDDK